MSPTDVRGSLEYESWMHDKIGVDQIYSPSGLYSILVHKNVIDGYEMFCLNKVYILNNSDFEVQQYKLEGNVPFRYILNVYWWTDTLLVCLDNNNSYLVQRVYSVNHEHQSIHYIKSTSFFSSVKLLSFWISDSCIILNETSYIAYCTADVENVGSFYINLVRKNPFSDENHQTYYVRLSNVSLTELKRKLCLEDYTLTFEAPSLTNKNKLLCCLKKNHYYTIFGIFLEIDVDKLENIAGKRTTIDEVLERQDENVFSIVYLPKPNKVAARYFYTSLHSITNSQLGNFCVMKEKYNCNVIRVVDFKTMQLVIKIVPKDGTAVLTMHPSGFIFQCFMREDKIEFRKINISWKSESLENISRRTILCNPMIDYSHIRGFQQFLFPGAQFIQKEKPKTVFGDNIRGEELNNCLAFVIVSLLIVFLLSLFIYV